MVHRESSCSIDALGREAPGGFAIASKQKVYQPLPLCHLPICRNSREQRRFGRVISGARLASAQGCIAASRLDSTGDAAMR
jgi:hypothetical protein